MSKTIRNIRDYGASFVSDLSDTERFEFTLENEGKSKKGHAWFRVEINGKTVILMARDLAQFVADNPGFGEIKLQPASDDEAKWDMQYDPAMPLALGIADGKLTLPLNYTATKEAKLTKQF